MEVWLKKKLDGQYYNIDKIVSTITWEGSDEQAARTVTIEQLNAPYDKDFIRIDKVIATGDIIELWEGNSTCYFSGEVNNDENTGAPGTISKTAADLTQHLLRSNGSCNFKNKTPEQITIQICNEMQIKLSVLAEAGVTLDKFIVWDKSLYDMILGAYQKAGKVTGKKYKIEMNGTDLSVIEKGQLIKYYTISDYSNITSDSYQETADNIVNRVLIYNDKKQLIGKVEDADSIKRYGIYQQQYEQEEGVDATAAATNMLTGIDKTLTVEVINPTMDVKAGRSIKLVDAATGLNAIFWITKDSHKFSAGTHTASLDLAFSCLVNEVDVEETEETEDTETNTTE